MSQSPKTPDNRDGERDSSVNGHMRMAPLSRALGLSVRQLERLVTRRIIEPAVPGRGRRAAVYDPLACAKRALAHYATLNRRDQLAHAQAQFVMLKLRRERGQLLPRAEFVRRGQLLAAALAAKVRSIPNRLVRAGMPAAQETEALAAVDELLGEIARWRDDQDLARAVADE